MKKILSAILTIAFACSCVIPVSAANSAQPPLEASAPVNRNLILVDSDKEIYTEGEYTIVEETKIYDVVQPKNPMGRASSAASTTYVQKTASISHQGQGEVLVITMDADFEYNSSDYDVSCTRFWTEYDVIKSNWIRSKERTSAVTSTSGIGVSKVAKQTCKWKIVTGSTVSTDTTHNVTMVLQCNVRGSASGSVTGA